MSEKLLYTLKIEGTQSELDRLKQINQNIKQLREEIKTTSETDAKTAEAKKLQLQQEQKAYRDLQREVQTRNKAERDSVQTLEKMRAQLTQLYKQLEQAEVGSKEFNKITQEAKRLSDQIRTADMTAGNFKSNIGNYAGSIMDAFGQMGGGAREFTGALQSTGKMFQTVSTLGTQTVGVFGSLNAMLKGITVSSFNLSNALKVLRLALISTGVGAIVVLLGSIVAYLTSTQAGLDKINKILKPLGAVLQRTLGIAQKLGEALFLIVSGKFREGWNQLKDTIASVGDEFSDAWQDGKRLAAITIEIEQARIKLAQNEGRLSRELEEQRGILQDVNKSQAERQKAADKFFKLNEELTGLQSEIVKLEIEQLELKQKQNDTDREGQKQLAEKQAELDTLQAGQLTREREVRTMINGLIRQGAVEREKALKAERELMASLMDDFQKRNAEMLAAFDQLQAKRKAAIAAEAKRFLLDEEEGVDDIPAIIQSLGELQQQEIRLARETTEVIKGTYSERLQALDSLLAAQLITEQQYAERKRQINQSIAADTIASLQNVAVQGSKIQKALFLFEKILATRSAFIALQEGLAKSSAAAPFPANLPLIAGFIAQTAGLISAIRSIAAPEPVKVEAVKKFATGVIGLDGSGTSTSDSISARLSKGESVMTAKATERFAPQLAAMEQAVGNVPNFHLGNRRFASGFIPAPTVPANDYQKLIRDMVQMVGEIPVVVSEQDITSTQQRVRKVKTRGDL